MNGDKKRKSEYLLSEIGEIDDKFLLEAENYRPQRRLLRHRPIIAAACVCCFIAIVLTAVLRGGLLGKNVSAESVNASSGLLNDDKNELYSEAFTEAVVETPIDVVLHDFDALLSSLDERRGYGSFAEIEREQEKTYILWRAVEGGRIFISRPLTSDEAEYISEHVGLGESVGESSPTLKFNVWILRGDGSIISPYLIGSC